MSNSIVEYTVLGLDPSLSNFGAAKLKIRFDTSQNCKIVGYDLIEIALSSTSPDKKKTRRKNEEDRARAVEHKDFLKRLMVDTDFVFCELPVGSQTARAMASYGICVGLSAWIELPFFVVAPADIKLAACKNKQATKEDMVNWAITQFPQAPWFEGKSQNVLAKNEHIADALGSIVAGVKTEQFKQAMLFLSRR